MNITVTRGKNKLAHEQNSHSFLYNDSYLTLEHYKVPANGGLSVTNHDDNDLYPPEYIYFVLQGKIDFIIGKDKYTLETMDSIRIQGYGHFLIYGVEDSSLLFFSASECEDADPNAELRAMIKQSEEHDPYTLGHNSRVGRIAGKLAVCLLPGQEVGGIISAGNYHDIGKINIPNEILNKKGKLTEEEYEIIKNHPVYTYEILRDFLSENVCKIARGHHEMLDGSGYPDHLKGDEISMGSRILAVADIFDALTSDRVYRKGYSINDALSIMRSMSGKLDSKVLDTLISQIDNEVIYQDKDGNYQ